MLDVAINIYFTLPYYAGIMFNAFNDLYILCSILCSKLCWHNRRVPSLRITIGHHLHNYDS